MKNGDDVRLAWVLADPNRERAVDPLGMGLQADRLADRLLPQLSVTTQRARYFSFLCWVVRKAGGSASARTAMHRLEAELALEEAEAHSADGADACPGVIGRARARAHLDKFGNWPAHPERLYKNTALATYRPAMRALGLLRGGRGVELTEDGERLARAFQDARGPKPRCLGDMSTPEQRRIKVLLGLDGRRKDGLSPAAARRRATWEGVRWHYEAGEDSREIVDGHRAVGSRASDVERTLHCAYVWELLSSGLALAFSLLLEKKRRSAVVTALRAGLAAKTKRPALPEISDIAEDQGLYAVALLRAALGARPDELGLDPRPARLAARLVRDRDAGTFIDDLVAHHRSAKAGEPWIALRGDQVVPLAPQKSLAFRVQPRSYRLAAFRQLVTDLGMI